MERTGHRMSLYAATQPIVEADGGLVGVEVLYRSSFHSTNALLPEGVVDEDGVGRTAQSMLFVACSGLLSRAVCWVNVPQRMLERVGETGVPLPFHPETVVVEVLEEVQPTPLVFKGLEVLTSLGYRVALDDCVLPRMAPFVQYADWLKVDQRSSTPENEERCLEVARLQGIDLVAEKVESSDEIERCASLGYRHFQGYAVEPPRNGMFDVILDHHDPFRRPRGSGLLDAMHAVPGHADTTPEGPGTRGLGRGTRQPTDHDEVREALLHAATLDVAATERFTTALGPVREAWEWMVDLFVAWQEQRRFLRHKASSTSRP